MKHSIFVALLALSFALLSCDKATAHGEYVDGTAGEAVSTTETESASEADTSSRDQNSESGRLNVTQSDGDIYECLMHGGEREGYMKLSGARADETVSREGSSYSAKWDNHTENSAVNLASPADITKYDTMGLWVYSEKATDAVIQVTVRCQTNADGKVGYIIAPFTVDWEGGWKNIEFILEDMGVGYSPDLTKVSGIRIHAKGWNSVPNKETVLYFDSVYYKGPSTAIV